MDIHHDTQRSPTSPKIVPPLLRAKTIFDGTKLSIEPLSPKTTTYGRNCSFQPISIGPNCTLLHAAVAIE